jgi:hypothetical protein
MIRFATQTIIALTTAAALATAGEVKLSEEKLSKLSKSAKSQADHKEVSRQYELRASELEAKARVHDQEAERLANRKGYNPMAHKWPAMVTAPVDRERSKAMQARRAARESMDLMAKHRELAAKASIEAEE